MTHDGEIVYHGQHSPGGKLVTLETPDGETLGLLRHVVRHCPGGFNWSYRGSGPAELGRCLLLDALGEAAVCPVCAGTGQLMHTEHSANGEEPPGVPYDPAAFDPVTMTTERCPGNRHGILRRWLSALPSHLPALHDRGHRRAAGPTRRVANPPQQCARLARPTTGAKPVMSGQRCSH